MVNPDLYVQYILWYIYVLNLGLVQCLRQLYRPLFEDHLKILDLHAPGYFVENQDYQFEIDGAIEGHLKCLDSH